eukprot:2343131-Amphidinium_carterae.1
MAGDVEADIDQTGPNSLSDRPGRDPDAQRNQPESAGGQVRAVVPARVERVHKGTETLDDISLKRAGTQGFVLHPTQRCIHCRMGAPEGLKIYECQAHGCEEFTCIRCAVPFQLTTCRQGLLCYRHFPYPRVTTNDPDAEEFWDNQPHNHHLSFKEINMSYAFMYMPLSRDEAMSQEITMTYRCCACPYEEGLVLCANSFCTHRACPRHVRRMFENHFICFCCDHTSRCDELHPFSPRDVVCTRSAPRRIMERWEREHAGRVREILMTFAYEQS